MVSGLRKDFGAKVIDVAIWERMLENLVENGKIVSERSYRREWRRIGWPAEATSRGQQESGFDDVGGDGTGVK